MDSNLSESLAHADLILVSMATRFKNVSHQLWKNNFKSYIEHMVSWFTVNMVKG